jgi:hypothetical protein
VIWKDFAPPVVTASPLLNEVYFSTNFACCIYLWLIALLLLSTTTTTLASALRTMMDL